MTESPPSSVFEGLDLDLLRTVLNSMGLNSENMQISDLQGHAGFRATEDGIQEPRPRSGNTNGANSHATNNLGLDSSEDALPPRLALGENDNPTQDRTNDNRPAESLKSRVERVFRNDQDSDSEDDQPMSKWFKEYPFKEFESAKDIKQVKKLIPKASSPARKLEEETINLVVKIYETDQLMRTDSLNFIKLALQEIFDESDVLEWLTTKYQDHETSFGFCQKASKSQRNFMYQCFDCFEGGEDTKKFVCSDCFAKGNHRGHKITRSFLGSICDCGSMNKVNGKSGNCSSHNGEFPKDTVLTQEKLLILEERIKAFIILVFKIVEKSTSFAAMKVMGEVLSNLFLRPLNKLMFTFPSMIPLLSMMFVTPLNQVGGGSKKISIEMQHNHKDLNSGFPALCKPQKCECSAFELIFRYSLKFTLRDQKRFNQLAHRLISYRPFMVELGGQWLKMYNKIARTKGESEEKKPPLANIKHDIVVDEEIMIQSVKKYGLTHFIDQIYKNIQEVIEDEEGCFIPGLNIKLPSSINVLPSITKYPENCLHVMKNPEFIKNLYPAFFKIYEKVLGQGLRLRKDGKFMESSELQGFLLRYQYDVYHSTNQLIFGLKNNPSELCSEPYLLNMRLVATLMLNTYQKRLAEPLVLKSFEGFGPRCFLTYLIGWLCLDCTDKHNPQIVDIKEDSLNEINSKIFFNQTGVQKYFYQRLCRTFADIIGSMFFIRRLKWDIWDQGWQKILQIYEKIEFDGIDICGLQFTFSQVKFEHAVAELFRGFFVLEGYQNDQKTESLDLDLDKEPLEETLKKFVEELNPKIADTKKPPVAKPRGKSKSKQVESEDQQQLPCWQKLFREHHLSYEHFASEDYGLEPHPNKLSLLLVDFFNLLTVVCSSEHSIFGVTSEMVLVRNSAFRRALLKQENKFYFPAAKMQFLHLMLALKTVPCDEFFDLIKAYVCCEEGFQESVVGEFCDVDLENQVIKLKPKAEELAMKNFDSSCFSLKRASEDFDNRWQQNIHKQFYNQLSFKKSYSTELVRLVRKQVSECDPVFMVDMVSVAVKMDHLSAPGKKTTALFLSITRFILLYLDCLQDCNFGITLPEIKKKFDLLVSKILPVLEAAFEDATIWKVFKAKLNEYRATVLSEQVLNKTVSTELSAQRIAELEEKTAQVNKEKAKVAQTFLRKKAAIFRRMKQRQSKFFSKLDHMTASFIKDFNTVASADTMVCSVTKEQLSNKETFFIFANMSESNLLHHAKINTLKAMASEKNMDQEDLQVIIDLIDEEKKTPKEKLDNVLISQCGHYLKSEAHAMIGDPKNGYRDNEYICPLCKSSSNCLLPIYTSDLWEGLKNDGLFCEVSNHQTEPRQITIPHRSSLDAIGRIQSYFDCYAPLMQIMTDNTRFSDSKQAEFKQLVASQREIAKGFVERIKTNLLVNIENLIKNGGFSIGCISSLEEPFFNICPASFALASTLRYSEIKGFAASIGAYGQVMHSLYMTARVERVYQGSFSTNVMTYMQTQFKQLEHATDYKPCMSVLLCIPGLLGESESDVKSLLRTIITLCMDIQLLQLLTPYPNTPKPATSLTWESVRYSKEHAYLVCCLIRFLRTCALLQYSMRFPQYQTEKKLLEQLIQRNLKGDETAELDYLFHFLDLSVLDLTDLPRRVERGLQMFGVKWQSPSTCDEMGEKGPQTTSTVTLIKKRREVNGSPVSLSLFQLGKTMKDALEIFYHTPCKHCGNKGHMASMCLICGEVICGLVCGFNGNIMDLKKNGVKGQLCKHSIIEHKGKTAYLNCESLFVLLFDDSRKIVFKGMYFNKFGKI